MKPRIKERDDMLKTSELAARWRLHPDTLKTWRRLGKGPDWVQLGGPMGPILYKKEAVEEYERTHTIEAEEM